MSDPLTRIAAWITDRQFYKNLAEMEDTSMTYKLMKRIIQKGGYDRESILMKLDVFLMADRITPEEYQELVELMGEENDG